MQIQQAYLLCSLEKTKEKTGGEQGACSAKTEPAVHEVFTLSFPFLSHMQHAGGDTLCQTSSGFWKFYVLLRRGCHLCVQEVGDMIHTHLQCIEKAFACKILTSHGLCTRNLAN